TRMSYAPHARAPRFIENMRKTAVNRCGQTGRMAHVLLLELCPNRNRGETCLAGESRWSKGERLMRASLLFERIRGEFNEMPGLQLTIAQAARLWGLDQASCRRVIDALVDAAFLRWTASGTVVRAEH